MIKLNPIQWTYVSENLIVVHLDFGTQEFGNTGDSGTRDTKDLNCGVTSVSVPSCVSVLSYQESETLDRHTQVGLRWVRMDSLETTKEVSF